MTAKTLDERLNDWLDDNSADESAVLAALAMTLGSRIGAAANGRVEIKEALRIAVDCVASAALVTIDQRGFL